jgi:hypothetical protein
MALRGEHSGSYKHKDAKGDVYLVTASPKHARAYLLQEFAADGVRLLFALALATAGASVVYDIYDCATRPLGHSKSQFEVPSRSAHKITLG